jgi:hypothetical protein
LVVTSPGDVHEVGSNVGDIELVNDFLETVQLIAGLHLEGTELISQLQLDIAGRVDALDLVATIPSEMEQLRISGSEPLGFVTVSPGRTTRGLTVITAPHQIDT